MLQLQTRHASNSKASTKIGMNVLVNFVLNLQRDIKRINNAISPKGEQEMVDYHNKGLPESPASRWIFKHEYVNVDGIPGVFITNSNDHSLYVNGYTTKKSDYQIRYEFDSQVPFVKSCKEALDHFGLMSKNS